MIASPATDKCEPQHVPGEGSKRQVAIAVPVFSYKNHLGIDRAHGFVRRYTITYAAVHDGSQLGAMPSGRIVNLFPQPAVTLRVRCADPPSRGVIAMAGRRVVSLSGCAPLPRLNATVSMPRGFWRVAPVAGLVSRGAIVSLCLPPGPLLRLALRRGYLSASPCPGGAEPLLKPVAAIAGDTVVISAAGIAVVITRLQSSSK